MSAPAQHLTVLLREAVEALAIKPAGVYVDATFGRGGHSRAILEALGPEGRLLALDRDPRAIAAAAAIGDEANSVAVSAASAMEVATKFRIGKLPEAALLAREFAAILLEHSRINLVLIVLLCIPLGISIVGRLAGAF